MLLLRLKSGNRLSHIKVFTFIFLVIFLLSSFALLQKPLQWSMMIFHTFSVQKVFKDSDSVLIYDPNINENLINKQNVCYCYDNHTVQITIPQYSGIIVLEEESDYIVEDCYLMNEFYYFILTKSKDTHGPSTVKNHKSDKLVKVNCDTGAVSNVYQTATEFILLSNNKSVLLFDAQSGSLIRLSLDSQERCSLLKIKKKNLRKIRFIIKRESIEISSFFKGDAQETTLLKNCFN